MALIKLAGLFILIVILLGLKKSQYLVMFGATILLGILFQLPMPELASAIGSSLISWNTWEVLLILWLVMLVEGVLDQYGFLSRMLSAMDALFHNKKVDIVVMPMLIGFLPSAGGAMFSAPIVAESTKGSNLSQEKKAIINNHYRHIMEIFFPTEPALIITGSIVGISAVSLGTRLFPAAVLMFLLGLVYLRNCDLKTPVSADEGSLGKRITVFLKALWPLLTLMILVFCGIPVWFACLLMLLILLWVQRLPLRQIPKTLVKYCKFRLLIMALSVLVFKDVMSIAVPLEEIAAKVALIPLPPLLTFSLLGMFITMVTGIGYASAGIMLPLLLAGIPDYTLMTIAVFQFFLYLGGQITPIHMCVTLSAEYFNANLQKLILQSLPIYLTGAILIYLIYGILL